MKKMKRIFAALLASAFMLSGCTSKDAVVNTGELGYSENQELTYLYSSEIPTFNYYANSSANVYELIGQCIDGLVENDKYGIVQPAIAKSWEVSDDGLVWTFHIRDDADWVDNKGNYVADVTAHDFVTAAQYVLDKDSASYYAYFYYDMIVNGREFYESKDTSEDWDGETTDNFSDVGVKALDDFTLEYTLIAPVPYFMSAINWIAFYPVYAPFLEEVGDDFGINNTKILYNGAMLLDTWEPNTLRVFLKNESYYNKDTIYITKETNIFNAEAATLAPEMFLRGEVNYATISTAILDEWLADPQRSQLIRPSSPSNYSYFYAFNFDPQFDEEFEPDNWKIAVNNKNFRLSIFHAFDRIAAISTSDPYNPQNHFTKTVTFPQFADVDGLDYSEIGALDYVSNEMPTYDAELAKEYRDKAIEELTEAGAKFPVKVLMPYNSSMSQWAERCQVIKANLERVLGTDFIEVIIDARPTTNFLANTRRNGNYAFLECNWGPDYADPETFSDPFAPNGTYNFPHMAEGYRNEDGKFIYHSLLEAAKAERVDIGKRFELFAEAEAFLITEAFIMPYIRSVPGWIASYMNPFDGNYSPTSSLSTAKYNNVRKLNSPLNADQFNEQYEQWKIERAEALKAESDK